VVCVCATVGWVMHVALACWHMCIYVCVHCFERKHPVHRAYYFAVPCVVMMYEYYVFSQRKHEVVWAKAEALKKKKKQCVKCIAFMSVCMSVRAFKSVLE